jgi:hypothetical protein
MSADIEQATKNTKAAVLERARIERERAQQEREAHEAEVEAAAEARMSQLDAAMESLTKGEQRMVRLHAATIVFQQGYQPGNVQERVDDLCLRLAKYTAAGIV